MVNIELHIASGDDDLQEVKRLVSEKADINAVSAAGLQPLHVAAGEGSYSVLAFLCEAGADLNAITKFGRETAVHRAAFEGHHKCVQRLAESRADLDALSAEGFSALHEASRAGDAQTVQVLLKNGASANLSSDAKTTALHLAVLFEHLDCVKFLVEARANIAFEDRDRDSPLDMAARISDPAKLETIMKGLGGWKPRLLMECLEEFVVRLQTRISKETGMTLDDPLKTVEHPRFREQEFKGYVTLKKLKDKRLADVTEGDVDSDDWVYKCNGVWYNCRRVLSSSLTAPRGERRRLSMAQLDAADAAQLARTFALYAAARARPGPDDPNGLEGEPTDGKDASAGGGKAVAGKQLL